MAGRCGLASGATNAVVRCCRCQPTGQWPCQHGRCSQRKVLNDQLTCHDPGAALGRHDPRRLPADSHVPRQRPETRGTAAKAGMPLELIVKSADR